MTDTDGVRRGGIAIGAGIAVIVAMVFVLPAGLLPPGAAWLVMAAVVVAVLFVPVSRWWRWPVADRVASVRAVGVAVPMSATIAAAAVVVGTAFVLLLHVADAGLVRHSWRVLGEGGVLMMLIVLGGALTYALRPVTPRAGRLWAERRGLRSEVVPPARRELRRIRAWRTVPAVFGAAVGVAPGSAYNLALEVQGAPPSAAATELLAIMNAWPYDPVTLALVGYLIGTVLAELTRRSPAREPGHRAHLETRTPTDYLVPLARWLPRVLAAGTLALTTAAVPGGSDLAWWPVGVALLLAAAVDLVQRWVVRRPQRVDPGAALQLDDALRSSAAHGVAGGGSALLLITASGAVNALTTTLWAGDDGIVGGAVGALTTVVAVVFISAVWGVWLGFGSAHRGQIPVRDQERVA